MFSRVFFFVRGEKFVLFFFLGGIVGRVFVVNVVDFLGNNEGFFGVEVEFFFELFNIVGFKGSIVDVVGVLLFRVEIDGGFEFDDGRFVGNSLVFFDGFVNGFKVGVVVVDDNNVLVVGFVMFDNIFCEGVVGVIINGDVVVIVDVDKVVKLKVIGE